MLQIYNVDNPVTAKNWPPMEKIGKVNSHVNNRELMHHLNQLEIQRMREIRGFEMPKIHPGDLVEVRYELSRSQQTFAVFRGYCVELRNKKLASSFLLKNSYGGIGVEQLMPRYSPRLLDVRVIKNLPNAVETSSKPVTRDYRYKWHYNVRKKFTPKEGQPPQKPGIRSMELKIRKRLLRLRKRYQRMRVEAGLAPYIYGGPTSVSGVQQVKKVRGETYRRSLIYSLDEESIRNRRWERKEKREKWGVYKMNRPPRVTAVDLLPSYHPLGENGLK